MRACNRPMIPALAATFAIALTSTLPAAQPALEPPSAKCLAVMQSFTRTASLRVNNRQDRAIGKMDDLLIDLHAGTVLCVLMTPTGAGDDVVIAVPAQSFSAADRKKAVLNATKELIQSAPRLADGVNDDATLAKVVADAYEHFHQPPASSGPSVPHGLVRASKFIEYRVRSRTGEDLGNVKDFMIDLLTARLVFGVLALDRSEVNRYAVPPEALTLDTGKGCLVLNAAKAQVSQTVGKGDLATEMADPEWAAATYRLYDSANAANAPADPTHENVREKVEPGPEAQAAARPALPDEEIRKRILTAIIRDDMGNAYTYKTLKIVTDNGRVTLQGRAKNPKQKAELGALAESVVGAANVDNQLEIRK